MSAGVKRPLDKSSDDQSDVIRCTLKRPVKNKGYGFHLLSEDDVSFIGSVAKNSIAETAGLKEGDKIVEVNGKNIKTFNHSKIMGMFGSNPLEVKIGYTRKQEVIKKDEEVASKKRKLCKFGAKCYSIDKCAFDHPPKIENKSDTNTQVTKVESNDKPLPNKTIEKNVTNNKNIETKKANEKPDKTKTTNSESMQVESSSTQIVISDDESAKLNSKKDDVKKASPVTNNSKQNNNIPPASKTDNSKETKKLETGKNVTRKCILRKWNKTTDFGFSISSLEGNSYVNQVSLNTPASQAGLKVGDFIHEINGESILGCDHAVVINKMRNSSFKVDLLVEFSPKFIDALAKQNEHEVVTISDAEPTEKDASTKTVIVHRIPLEGFGFSIVAVEDDKGAYVNNIKPSSSADIAGLKVDDVITEVEGTSAVDLDYRSIVDLISKSTNKVKLVVKAWQQSNDASLVIKPLISLTDEVVVPSQNKTLSSKPVKNIPSKESSPQISTLPQRKCILHRDRNFNGFGFGVTTNTDGKGVYVDSVEPYSPAQIAGLLVGDSIASVDGNIVTECKHEEIVGLIAKSRFKVELSVCNSSINSDAPRLHNPKESNHNSKNKKEHSEEKKLSNEDTEKQRSNHNIPQKLMDINLTPRQTNTLEKPVEQPQKPAVESQMNGDSTTRSCLIFKSPTYDGYGFALNFGKQGAYIETVERGSPAEQAHLKVNDIVTHVNKKSIKGMEEDPIYDIILEKDDAVEFGVLIPEEDPMPRQCHLRRNQSGFGFNIVPIAAGIGAQIIAVEPDSVSDIAGIKVGDVVLEVNGRKVQHIQYKSIIDGIKMSGGHVKLIVISHTSKQNGTPEKEKEKDTGSIWIPDTEAQKAALDAVKNKASTPLQKCLLRRSRANESYGFGLVYDASKGHIVSDILDNTPAHHADLRVGDCLIEVNQVNVEKLQQYHLQQILGQKPMQVEFTVRRNEETKNKEKENLPSKFDQSIHRGQYCGPIGKIYSK